MATPAGAVAAVPTRALLGLYRRGAIPLDAVGTGRQSGITMTSSMNAIAELLAADNILLDLAVANQDELFNSIGRLLELRHVLGQSVVAASLAAREKLGSTGLGAGVAVPHARVARLQQALAFYVRPKTPLAFAAPDGKPVGHIIVILIPERATQQHLQLLAATAELFQDLRFTELLKRAPDAASAAKLFADWPAQRRL